MLESYDDLLTVEELCELLKIGHNAAYELLNSGKLKAFRNGRTWRISSPWYNTSVSSPNYDKIRPRCNALGGFRVTRTA